MADSKGGGSGAAPPIGSYFFQKAAFVRVKGIYFVVRIKNFGSATVTEYH